MPKPQALIVDDSRTAQVRLRKMLERYYLDIETATSAEEALSYLSYRSPTVVFMDHHMEGMDGLEALRIMKANPATAMIPVIMYTSEKGDVYVGQARAMGALDILSKEVIKPSSLAKVLSSLNIPLQEEVSAAQEKSEPEEEVPAPARNINIANEAIHGDLQAVRSQIARLFEIHIADVRQQVADSTKFIVRRLSRDMEDRLEAVTARNEEADLAPPPAPRESSGAGIFFSLLILLGLVAVGWQTVNAGREQRQLSQSLARVEATLAQQRAAIDDLIPAVGTAPAQAIAAPANANASQEATRNTLLQAVSWAANLDPEFSYGQLALNEERAGEFAQLLNLLKSVGFTGRVSVELYFGNFCVVRTSGGEWVLPPASTTLAECTTLDALDLDFTVDDQLSVAFMQLLQTQPELAAGKINLNLHSRGLNVSRFEYPQALPDVKASEWNRAAQRNNRLAIHFTPSARHAM